MSKSVFRVTRNKTVSYVVAPDLLSVVSDLVAASGRPPQPTTGLSGLNALSVEELGPVMMVKEEVPMTIDPKQSEDARSREADAASV
jgi:hypothetical protein